MPENSSSGPTLQDILNDTRETLLPKLEEDEQVSDEMTLLLDSLLKEDRSVDEVGERFEALLDSQSTD